MNNTKAAAAKPATPIAVSPKNSVTVRIAERLGVDPDKLLATLKATAFYAGKDKELTNEQMMALLIVADAYRLNPVTKEIYAFPDSNRGGIVPIVSVDGWIRIINERPELSSIEFDYAPDDSEDPWISCTITRKDRDKPITVREYLKECWRDTGPWKSHSRRMLRHKALIQCGRVAFGFAGIYDPDEAERIREARTIEGQVVTRKANTEAPRAIESDDQAARKEDPAIAALRARLEQYSVAESALCARFEIGSIEELPFDSINAAYEWIAQAERDQ